ncbi:MAG: KR domain-containing protein, partial [Myxococcales bacterium]|nr:KR domain-containing protein [Myxococcales bacterium]
LDLTRVATDLRRVTVQGATVLATADLLEFVVAAAAATWPEQPPQLDGLELAGPLLLPDDPGGSGGPGDPRPGGTLQLVLDEADTHARGQAPAPAKLRLFVRRSADEPYRLWASGSLRFDAAVPEREQPRTGLDAIVARCSRRDDERWSRLAARGVALPGPRPTSLRAGTDPGELLLGLERTGPAARRLPIDAIEAGLWLIAELAEDPDAPPIPGQLGDLAQVSSCIIADGDRQGPPTWLHLQLARPRGDAPSGRDERTTHALLTLYDDAGRICLQLGVTRRSDVAPALARRLADAALPDWLYAREWEPAPALSPEPADLEGAVLLISDDRELARACIEPAHTRGAALESIDAHDLVDRSACHDALRRARARGPLRALILALVADVDDDALEALVRERARLILDLAAALHNDGGRLRLLLVTRASQPAIVEPSGAPTITVAGLAAAPAWGLTRAIGLEHPAIEVRGLDLAAAPSPEDPRRIIAELTTDDREEAVAYRGDQRLRLRLRRAPITTDREPTPLPPRLGEGTTLITGGLGGVGLQLAAHLADAGARRLLLLGRSPL